MSTRKSEQTVTRSDDEQQPGLAEKARECRASATRQQRERTVTHREDNDGDLAHSAPDGDRG